MKLSSSPPSFRTMFRRLKIVPKMSLASSAAVSLVLGRGCEEGMESEAALLMGSGDEGGCESGRDEEFMTEEEERGR
jgi:hypothetical protein